MPFLIIGLFIAFFIAAAVFSHYADQKRTQAMSEAAARLGLQFQAGKDHSIDERYSFLNKLCQGKNRYGFNIMHGVYRQHSVMVFDYHYLTESRDSKGNRKKHHHYFSFFMLKHPGDFPELLISREGWMSKIAQFFGFDDIDFESAEFSRLFKVKSPDKRFAYDICHGRMIDYLLANTDLNIEIERNMVTLFFQSRLDAHQIGPNLDRLVTIREYFPSYLNDR